MKINIKTRAKSQDGIAMMVALMALVLLAAIGMGLMFMADTENSINNNYRDSQRAYFAARAGADNVRVLLAPGARFNPDPINNPFALKMPTSAPATLADTGVIYVLNPGPNDASGVDPITGAFVDDELCQEQFGGLGLSAAGNGIPCGTSASQIMTTSAFYLNDTKYLKSIGKGPLKSSDIPGLNSADALAFKWVRITNKQNLMGMMGKDAVGNPQTVDPTHAAGEQVCWTGNKEIAFTPNPAAKINTCLDLSPPATPVWLITSLAVTPKLGANPGSRRMVQMEAALNPAIVPPGTISAKAPVNLQGSFILNSYDSCKSTCTYDKQGAPTGCTGPAGYAVFTENAVTQTGGAGQTLNPTGPSQDPPTTASNADPTRDPVSKMNVADKDWPYNMDDLINTMKQAAQVAPYKCTGTQDFYSVPPKYLDCGTQSNQMFYINNDPTQPVPFPPSMLPTPPNPPVEPLNPPTVTEYIPGSVKMTAAAQGAGILIVDGDLEINGGLNWYGLLLVRGKVSFTGGAGQSTNLYGAILAGEDILAVNSFQADKFGGSINFNYDTCALKNNGGNRPPRLLATHELMY